jgi:GNAT superfamily N-acetyltransferase
MSPTAPRLLRSDERDVALETMVLAFQTDPAWMWMFETAGDPVAGIRGVMACVLDGGLLNNSVWRSAACECVAVWVPPGASELTPELEERAGAVLAETGPETLKRALELFGIFDSTRAKAPLHHYLSVFATLPSKQGAGLGGAVMRAAFEAIDAHSYPCYLESSNPTKNGAMYAHLGFDVRETLETPPGCPMVETMWRPAR